jgi:uncharacterized protein (DUF2062 family)
MAAGLAAGASVSCMPLPGLHFLLALALAWATRGGALAAIVGTAFGNPWTFPLLWGAAYRLGSAVSGGGPVPDEAVAADVAEEAGGLLRAIISPDADPSALAASLLPIWLPAMLGSVPIAATVWVVVYVLARAAAGERLRGRGGPAGTGLRAEGRRTGRPRRVSAEGRRIR